MAGRRAWSSPWTNVPSPRALQFVDDVAEMEVGTRVGPVSTLTGELSKLGKDEKSEA
jgi:hypothetical protein